MAKNLFYSYRSYWGTLYYTRKAVILSIILYVAYFLTDWVAYREEMALMKKNPFDIKFAGGDEALTLADYDTVLHEIKQVDTLKIVKILAHDLPQGATDLGDFYRRTMNGTKQIFHDPSRLITPHHRVKVMGSNKEQCIITSPKLHGQGYELSERFLLDIEKQLGRVGYQGRFISAVGGFPNPTGEEIKMAAVPYVFKMFLIIEVYLKYDCQHVLWIDSCITPLSSLDPLFEHIQKYGTFLRGSPGERNYRFILPATRRLLLRETGVDVLKNYHVPADVMGWDMGNELVKGVFKEYYRLAKMGTPFLSCFPEEFVISAILHKTGNEKLLIINRSLVDQLIDDLSDSNLKLGLDKDHRYIFAKQRH